MSGIHRAFSTLNLSIPEHVLELTALFVDSYFFTSNIELDYIGCIANFQNYRSLDLKPHLVALLNHSLKHTDVEISLASLYPQDTDAQLICSTKEDEFSSILIVFPAVNNYFPVNNSDFEFCLLRFTINELLGSSTVNHIKYIQKLEFCVDQLQKKGRNLQSQIQNINLESTFKQVCDLNNTNHNLSIELDQSKNIILELYYQFKALEDEERINGKHLACVVCCSNPRNVMYMPCGHVIVCTMCFGENDRIKSGVLSMKSSTKCQSCQKQVVKASVVYF